MRYRVSAMVLSQTELPSNVRVKANQDEYLFEVNKDHLLTQVVVERKVKDYHEILPAFHFGVDGTHTINLPHLQSPLHKEMVESLQYIESLGSFLLSISKIKWQDVKWEWIPESDDEKEQIEVLSAHFQYDYPVEPIPVLPELIARMLAAKPRLEKLMIIPMSFFREGSNSFRENKYAIAFMYYYLYLENMYGNGKTRNADIEREFIQSKHVSGGIKYWLDHQTGSNGDPRHLLHVQALLDERDWTLDIGHVVKLLVRLRAEVHHSSKKNKRRQAHPLNQEQYRTIAYLTLGVCIHSIIRIYDHNEEPQ